MKIISLEGTNYTRLKAVEITPKDNTIVVSGANGQGKTSVLNLIKNILGGKKYSPMKPIREGEDHAEGTIKTENWIIKRSFAESGKETLTITNADGMKAQSPQKLLEKVVGEIGFDPMEFCNLGDSLAGKRQQRTMLMGLVGLDFSDIDNQVANVKQERTEVRSIKEAYEHEANGITVAADTPDEEVSAANLSAELQKAISHNAEIERLAGVIIDTEAEIKRQGESISRLDERIAILQAQIEDLTGERNEKAKDQNSLLSKREEWLAEHSKMVKVNVAEIEESIASIETTNQGVRQKKQKAEMLKKIATKTAEYSKLGKKMKELEQTKATRLAEAKMPVEGLSVSEECVLYDGIPLSQQGGAKELEISMAIAMEKNPELRVIIMQGNELDDTSLEVVKKLVKDKDYQVWIERWKSDETGIVIEDGTVKD